ncbi:putative very-long-chain (3R)-3-hydroxyacyl-CoA dehydratase [Helianthus anomalus]
MSSSFNKLLHFSASHCRPTMATFLSLLRFQVLFLTLKTLKESGHAHVYSNIQKPLLFAQTAAFLEVWQNSCVWF